MALQKLTITRLDGTEITVTPNLGDTLNFERTLKNNPRWGTLQENVLRMQPFRAWSAGKREGTITETWEEFVAYVTDVQAAGTDDDADTVDGLGKDTATTPPTI